MGIFDNIVRLILILCHLYYLNKEKIAKQSLFG